MKKLYVGNIHFYATERDLQEWFAEAGFKVEGVNLLRDRHSNELRGSGFVEIRNDAEANRAIKELNGKEFGGRALIVNEARPPREGARGRGDRGRARERDYR